MSHICTGTTPVLHVSTEPLPARLDIDLVSAAIGHCHNGSYPNYPVRETPDSSGFDLRAWISEPLTIEPGACHLVSSGLRIQPPEGYGAFLFPRSGLGHKHGLVLGNLTGVIDADYKGILHVSLYNRSSKPYTVQPLERIAQCVLLPVLTRYLLSHCVQLPEQQSIRGEGGFGSTGKQ